MQEIEELFNKEVCIVIQGPLTYEQKIIETYYKFKDNIIISTNDECKFNINEKFSFVKNNFASHSGRANFNNQVINTLNGINKGKELGFKYVLKIRSDIFIDNINELLKNFDLTKIYFSAYHLHDGGYLCEHMLFGEINFMSKLWDIPISYSDVAPETQLTNHFDKINDGKVIDFVFPILYKRNINAYWEKYQKFLNEYEFDKLFIYERK